MIMLDGRSGSQMDGGATAGRSNNSGEQVIEIPDEPMDNDEIRVENIPF